MWKTSLRRDGALAVVILTAMLAGAACGSDRPSSRGTQSSTTSSGVASASAVAPLPGRPIPTAPRDRSGGSPRRLARLQLRSIDNMHLSRDTMCYQVSAATIEAVVAAEARAHADTATVDMPYDDASSYGKCVPRDPLAYERQWITTIRRHGMHVWFRQQWLTWQGNQGAPKLTPTTTPSVRLGEDPAAVLDGRDTTSYLARTYQWILAHRDFFASGDIFTPESEPANAGIVPYCQSPCMFADHAVADRWLADSMAVDRSAFATIGVQVGVGYWGLACTPNVASRATAHAMGVFVTDCYYRSPAVLAAKLTALYEP